MTAFPEYDDKIADNLIIASQACYENGSDLLAEANILYEQERYARATSLAIIAEEEFSKSLILQSSSVNRMWHKELYDGLKVHVKKQAFSGALSGLMDALKHHISMAGHSILPMQFDLKRLIKEEVEKAQKAHIVKQKIDKVKQDAQFVAIGRTGLPCKTPKAIKQKDADVAIDSAVRFRAYIDARNHKLKDDHPLFRGATTTVINGGVTTLNHKSGITVKMKDFDWVKTGCEPDKVIMNPHIILPELDTYDPKKLDREQKTNLARIYKAYDFPGQIRAEMQKLGLRGRVYLDEVESLIKKYAKK